MTPFKRSFRDTFNAILALTVVLPSLVDSACTFSGPCTFDNIQSSSCNIGGASEARVKQACDDAAFKFGEISSLYYQFDENFIDGDGAFNDQMEGLSSTADIDKDRITRFKNNALSNTRVLWPEYDALQPYYNAKMGGGTPYMDNFDLDRSCDLRTVVCCFTDTINDASKPFTPNARACGHDLAASAKSNHIANGWGVYESSTDNAYCVGFSWDADEASVSNRYKGSSLFDASFGTYLQKGFTKNIPGTPMCGCVENMPSITDAACREVVVTGESYEVTGTGNSLMITQVGGSISFRSCGSDLLSDYKSGTATMAEAAQLENLHLVGDTACDAVANRNWRFYVPQANPQAPTLYDEANKGQWTKFAGGGLLYPYYTSFDTAEHDANLRDLLSKSSTNIIMRVCPSCIDTHQHIYYKRITPVPTYINLFVILTNSWTNNGNTMGTDFKLYSTYQDAMNDVDEWAYCDYNVQNQGFPNECGPTEEVKCQWNSVEKDPCYKEEYTGVSWAFYVDVPGMTG